MSLLGTSVWAKQYFTNSPFPLFDRESIISFIMINKSVTSCHCGCAKEHIVLGVVSIICNVHLWLNLTFTLNEFNLETGTKHARKGNESNCSKTGQENNSWLFLRVNGKRNVLRDIYAKCSRQDGVGRCCFSVEIFWSWVLHLPWSLMWRGTIPCSLKPLTDSSSAKMKQCWRLFSILTS